MCCGQCGAEIGADDRFCRRCGSEPGTAAAGVPVRRDVYASIWRRGWAALIDGIVEFLLFVPLIALAAFRGHNFFVALLLAFLTNGIARLLLSVSYYALFEAGAMRATPGKYLLGLAVVDVNGDRIGWAQAYGREFAKLLSVLVFMIGLFMIAVTRRRQGLHDKLAGTRVVYRGVDDRLMMADPLAPTPHPVSVIGAFLITFGVLTCWVAAQTIGGAPPAQLWSNYWHVATGVGRAAEPKGQVVARAKSEIYDLKIESAQAIEHVFNYVEAHGRWPDSLEQAGFENQSPNSTRVVYDADLKQITAFGQRPPLKGRSLQRRVTGRTGNRYDVVCSSPDIPRPLLPHGCQPRK